MKTVLICGICATGIFLMGCTTTFVERRHGHGSYGYYDNGGYGYRDGRYYDGYHGSQYRTLNVGRRNVYESDVYRPTVNRSVVRTYSTGGGFERPGQKHTSSKVHKQSSKKFKGKHHEEDGSRSD